MTTVRFLMRWFYHKSTRSKLRKEAAAQTTLKAASLPVAKPKAQAPTIKCGNPVRWHF